MLIAGSTEQTEGSSHRKNGRRVGKSRRGAAALHAFAAAINNVQHDDTVPIDHAVTGDGRTPEQSSPNGADVCRLVSIRCIMMMGRLAVGERSLAKIKWYRCGLIATPVHSIALDDTVQSFCIVAAIGIMDGILTI